MKTIITALAVVTLLTAAPVASLASGGGIGAEQEVSKQVDGR